LEIVVGEVLLIDAEYHIMYTFIMSIQNVVLFVKKMQKVYQVEKKYFLLITKASG